MNNEEDVTAQLLRLAGAPLGPSEERIARARTVVHDEWRALRQQQTRRRAAVVAIAALGVAASIAIVVWMKPQDIATIPSGSIVATGIRVQGQPLVRHAGTRGVDRRPLSVAMPIRDGDVIETDTASRASLQTSHGSSIRIDRASRVRFVSPALIELIAGAAYIATADGSRGFEVRTPMGAVRDVGTQFEVRLFESMLRLRVRTGMVAIHRGAGVTAAGAGTEATVTTNGIAIRQASAYGSEWEWTADLAPAFAAEGRLLRDFLEHTAREQGWTLRYNDPAVAEAAGRITLHGSLDGLRAEDALGVALTTSGLEYRLRDGELLVSRPADAR